MSYYLNQDLKDRLEEEFSPIGLVAYSGCCRWGCTGSYGGDGQDDFEDRKNGIYYIRLHLEGMNYDAHPDSCYASYCAEEGDAHEYLMDHWDEEVRLIRKFCEILGLTKEDYTISKPPDARTTIGIHFNRPLNLDEVPDEP